MNIANLITRLQETTCANTLDSNREKLLAVMRSIELLKVNAVGVLQTFSSLPSASSSLGKLYFIQAEESLYYSTGNVWIPVYEPTSAIAYTWGANFCGVLGDNSSVSKASPVVVVGGFTDWRQVSAGGLHAVGVRENGTLWAWGRNVYTGQLGDGTTIGRSSPVSVVGGFTDWCQASAGITHTLAVRKNGSMWAWGCGACGELGNATACVGALSRTSPVSIGSGITDWCDVSLGYSLAHALRPDGNIWAWGSMGTIVTATTCGAVPAVLNGGFTDWCRVSTGNQFGIGIRSGGTLWSWGSNNYGRLGDGTTTTRSSPVSVVGGFTDWCQISAGCDHILAIRTNCTLWGWGRNNSGRIGDGSLTNRSSPVSVVGGFTDWCQASAGMCHGLAIRTNGTLWAWGSNCCGRLGDGTTTSRLSPVSVVGGFTDWCQASAGSAHSAAIRTNGTLWTWGAAYNGILGNNTTVARSSPVSVVGGFTDWCRVSTGFQSTLALRTNGTLWAWGTNGNGQLGDGTITNRSSPVSVVGGLLWQCPNIRSSVTTALGCDGRIWVWGRNQYQLHAAGIEPIFNFSSPVSVVGGFTDWCQASAGSTHSLGIRCNGTLWTWGLNQYGRLGNNSTGGASSSPVSVVGGFTDWCCGVTTDTHVHALRCNGTLWAWGTGSVGEIGDGGSFTSHSSPVSVVGGFTWCDVGSGSSQVFAIKNDGTLWGWGRNGGNALGAGVISSARSPVYVLGGFTNWCQVASGVESFPELVAAIKTDGTLWTWGACNSQGQLGNGSTIERSSPTQVTSICGWSSVSLGCRWGVGIVRR